MKSNVNANAYSKNVELDINLTLILVDVFVRKPNALLIIGLITKPVDVNVKGGNVQKVLGSMSRHVIVNAKRDHAPQNITLTEIAVNACVNTKTVLQITSLVMIPVDVNARRNPVMLVIISTMIAALVNAK